MDATERRFAHLTHLVLDGIASEAERAELAQLSAEHPERVAAVFDELTLDALLKWQSGNIIEQLPFLGDAVSTTLSRPLQQSRKSVPLWIGMIAATMLIATGLAAWKFVGMKAVEPIVADIIQQQEVDWSEETTALVADGAVRRGRLSSTSGEYTLQFRDGSTVRVVGPASLEIKSKMLVQLDRGRATANVPVGSTGFTIASALIDVVDQGTEFGISVDDGRADVVVFDGKVDVNSNVGQPGPSKRLTEGEAIKVDQQGVIGRLTDIRRDIEGRWWTDHQSGPGGQVIASVSDNIHGGDAGKTFACYQTTFEGLREDALAFSDNPHHQWNGLTADGLPDYLRGADYIKTFNHYRYMRFFKMTIEFARPANLYVFADNRIPPPAWLVEQFEDTGDDIGLDEGPWLDNIPAEFQKFDVNKTADGAGNSIDNVFSVWRRRCEDGQPITLGDAGEWGVEGGQGRAMYGVAATPLDEENATDQGMKFTIPGDQWALANSVE
jgi:ferric-dicitrate binding protein FerR (iron transport regulator)